MDQSEAMALLNAIGRPGHARDVASVRLTQLVVGAERARIVHWLRQRLDANMEWIANAIEQGDHHA